MQNEISGGEQIFLEISVVETQEKGLSHLEILQKIIDDYTGVYCIPHSSVEIISDSKCRFSFQSEQEFWAFYDVDFNIYNYMYDNLLTNYEDFPRFIKKNLFLNQTASKPQNNEDDDFYLIIKLRTNFINPLKRNFELTYKINEIFGDQVFNEEVADGYLRFYKTKVDFENNLLPINNIEAWIEWFKNLNIDITHPIIQNFLKILKSCL
ncbi:MAG: hypothetical protein ACTSVZ_01845 [Promethearchaeota archaeon]